MQVQQREKRRTYAINRIQSVDRGLDERDGPLERVSRRAIGRARQQRVLRCISRRSFYRAGGAILFLCRVLGHLGRQSLSAP